MNSKTKKFTNWRLICRVQKLTIVKQYRRIGGHVQKKSDVRLQIFYAYGISLLFKEIL